MKKNSERSAAMRFTMKLSILLMPFIALLVVYFLNDPFMVLRHYNRYDNSPVMLYRLANVYEQPGFHCI